MSLSRTQERTHLMEGRAIDGLTSRLYGFRVYHIVPRTGSPERPSALVGNGHSPALYAPPPPQVLCWSHALCTKANLGLGPLW